MPLNGKVQCIDHCIVHIVASLNAGGVSTIASCYGHGEVHGNIALEDGRVLIILPETPENTDEWRKVIGTPLTECDTLLSNDNSR